VTGPVPAGLAHEVLIADGSARSTGGINKGKPANPRLPWHYPMVAVCCICHGPVSRERMQPGVLDWSHTGRMPGGE
jgi:hypothetical protein